MNQEYALAIMLYYFIKLLHVYIFLSVKQFLFKSG